MLDFPLYMPEKKKDEKMVFYRYFKNGFNDKNYILCLDIKPTADTLDILGFNSFRIFQNHEELKDFFKMVKKNETSIEGIMLLNEDDQRFLTIS